MNRLQKLSLCFFIFLALFPVVRADETAVTPDKLHISYLRQCMANKRFFDRLVASDNRSGMSIEFQVMAGREKTRHQYQWILRECPIDASMPYLVFYSVAYIVGGTAYANKQAISDYFMRSSAFAQILMAAAAFLGVGLTTSTTVSFGVNAYYGIFVPKLAEENLILDYGAKKNLLDKRTQHYVEDELFYSFWRSPGSEALKRLQNILDKALRLPFYSRELAYDERKIEEALRNYPPQLTERLKLFAHSEIMYQQTDSTIQDSHYPVYFQGAPGVGKTYAARQLAEAMGTNLAIVTLDGASIDNIIGTPFESVDASAGRILDAMIARTDSSQDINHHNQVLLIDEFDRLFISGNEKSKGVLSLMMKLLDPANRHFYSRYLKTEVRLPDTIILAGNHDIHALSAHDPELQAIASRLDKIVFEGFDSRAKKRIVTEVMIPNKEKRYQSAGKQFADFTLPEQGWEMIEAFIETDQDPGLRSLEMFISKVFDWFAYSFAGSKE